MHPSAAVQRVFRRRLSNEGFSLIEVTVAVGIASMGIIMLFGLLPSGLTIFRNATNVAVSAQIAQRLVQEAVQTDYDTLVGTGQSAVPAASSDIPINKGWRYFDEEGIELLPEESSIALYQVLTRVIPATTLPSTTSFGPSRSLATVTVQVAVNPSARQIPLLPMEKGNSLSGTIDPKAAITFYTFTAHVAKSK